MAKWLEDNDEDVPPQADNPNFDAGHETHDMAGMATPAQLRELEEARGVDLDRRYLELMIAHHEGGIEMADAVLARSEVPQVRAFASGMLQTQQSEVDAMQAMLVERG